MKRDMGDGKDVVWERQDSFRNRSSVPAQAPPAACAASAAAVLTNTNGKSPNDVSDVAVAAAPKHAKSSEKEFSPPAFDFLCPACRSAPLDRSQSERKRPPPLPASTSANSTPPGRSRAHQIAGTTLSAESYACKVCKRTRTAPGPRVKLHLLDGDASKRTLSHHSSSDEEWFEKVIDDSNGSGDRQQVNGGEKETAAGASGEKGQERRCCSIL